MKCRLVLATAFLVYALVMPGNAPASDNLGQSGSKGTDAEHDEKNNHPETAANHQSQPSVTINAVPQIDVKRDWMDRATLIVGILLLLVGGGTGGVILYQSLQTKLATEAMQKSTKLQEVAMRQWVGTGNWRGKMDIARRALNVSFEVSNPTKIPLTFESASIIASGGQRFDIKARNSLAPDDEFPISISISIRDDGLPFPDTFVATIIGSVAFTDGFERPQEWWFGKRCVWYEGNDQVRFSAYEGSLSEIASKWEKPRQNPH